MIDYLKQNKGAIIAGLIASIIFLYLLNPLLKFISIILFKFFSIFSKSLVNQIFQQISHLETQDYSFFILSIILIPTLSFITIFNIFLCKKIFSKRDKLKEKTTKKVSISLKKTALISLTLNIILILLLITVLSSNFTQLSLISSFKRHFRIIEPYISDQEEEQILSDWSLMKTKDDYDKIYIQIHSIAVNNNIILPKNEIYNILSL